MNDLRDEIRSAIAEMVDDAPAPAPFDDIVNLRSRRPSLWAGPRLAVAVFTAVVVVIGAVALIRPFDGTPPSPLADLPTLDADVDGPSLDGAYAIPSYLPDGIEPIGAERNWMAAGVALRFSDGAGSELSVAADDVRGMEMTFEPSAVANRLTNAYPAVRIAETTVRGHPAFVLDGGNPATDGWTSAVVVIESPTSVSRVLGFDVSASEVLAVARGLQRSTADEYEQWAVEAIDPHLHVAALVADAEAFVDAVDSVDGVTDVQRLRDHSVRSDPVFVLISNDADQTPTTTEALSTDDTVVAAEESGLVRLTITLDDPAMAEAVAGIIADMGSAQITYSPAVAATLTETYLSQILADATVVHTEPTILQPSPGPEPEFDVAGLGTEVSLHPATEALPSAQVADVDSSLGGSMSQRTTLRGPILHIGSLDDDTRLVITFDGGADYAERTMRGSGWNGGAGSLRVYGYGVTGYGGSSAGPLYVQVRVPVDTVVAVLTLNDGTRLWQRPIAGHGLFPVEGHGSGSLHATVTAFAADGGVIGEWSQPDNG